MGERRDPGGFISHLPNVFHLIASPILTHHLRAVSRKKQAPLHFCSDLLYLDLYQIPSALKWVILQTPLAYLSIACPR